MRRYLLSMGIRTACFVLAVIALGVLHWAVVGWTLVIAAVILPYIAVVIANAKRPRGTTDLGPMTQNRMKDNTMPSHGATQQIAPRRPDEEPQP
jgi:Protein of unknown function (DUF3099)